MNPLQTSILKTISYFDIFEYPLTLIEIKKYLFTPESSDVSLDQIKSALADIDKIASQNGFYFLSGKSQHIQTRLDRYLVAEQKFKKRKKIIRLLCMMPHVKFIGICNSLANSNARDNSDIDLFIITTKNHVWTTRSFTAGLISLFGLRPEKDKTKNTICLSFFTDENNLNFEKLQSLDNDIYLKYWITQILPLYDENKYFQKFIKQNSWLKKSLPNWLPQNTSLRRKIKLNFIEKAIKNILQIFSFDSVYKKMQLRVLSPELKELKNKDSRVIINDSMLKLYPLDRRKQYFEEWNKRVS